MTFPLARTVRKLKQAISRRLPQRRDDSGLTTLEWLLIVAAVAGLAALAVVLVQNVVSETSEQIAGSSARETAAKIAAVSIMEDSDRDADDQPAGAKTMAEWRDYYTNRCRRLSITYGDAGVTVTPRFVYAKAAANTQPDADDDPIMASYVFTGTVDGDYLKADGTLDTTDTTLASIAPEAGKAHAECRVS